VACLLFLCSSVKTDRGNIINYKGKFAWSGSGDAFVPNYIMFDVIGKLRHEGNSNKIGPVKEEHIDKFISIYFDEHGFNCVQIPVYGQWFHIDEDEVSQEDKEIDQKTFDKLTMIIDKVYQAGGCTHIWMWGDASRKKTLKDLQTASWVRKKKNEVILFLPIRCRQMIVLIASFNLF
jgi:hypothetical protein